MYLDCCCYNRPFDEQAQLCAVLETLAKLNIQQQMRDGVLEYVWSSRDWFFYYRACCG